MIQFQRSWLRSIPLGSGLRPAKICNSNFRTESRKHEFWEPKKVAFWKREMGGTLVSIKSRLVLKYYNFDIIWPESLSIYMFFSCCRQWLGVGVLDYTKDNLKFPNKFISVIRNMWSLKSSISSPEHFANLGSYRRKSRIWKANKQQNPGNLTEIPRYWGLNFRFFHFFPMAVCGYESFLSIYLCMHVYKHTYTGVYINTYIHISSYIYYVFSWTGRNGRNAWNLLYFCLDVP